MRLARLKASRQWSLRVALRPQLHLVCFTCRRTFSNPRVYEIHQLRHARMTPYSCRECRLEFCTFIEVRQHMQNRHRLRCVRKVSRCRRCGETLPRSLQDKLQHFSACRRSQRCPAWFVTGVVGSENASKALTLNNVEDNLSDRSDLSIPFFSVEDMKALPDLEKETKAALDWTCQRCGLTILSDDHLRTHLCISLMEPETSNSQSLLTLPMTQSNSRSLSTDTCCETSNSQSRSTFATKDSNSQSLDANVKCKLSSQASTDSDSRSFDTNPYNDTSNSRIKSLTNTIDGRDVKLEEAVFPRYNVDLDADMNISLESFGSPVLDYRSCSNSPVKTARWVCKDCSFPFNTRKLYREHRQKFHSAKRLPRKRKLPDKEKKDTPPLVISVEDGPSMVISLDDEEEDMCYVSMKRENSESVSLPNSLQAIKSEPQEKEEKEAVNVLHLMDFDESNTKPLTPLLPEAWCDQKSPTYSRQFSSDVASSSKSSFSEYCSSVRESNTIIASSLNSSSTPEIEDHTNFGSAAEMFVSLEDDEATRFSLFSPRETQEEDSNFIESGVKMEETSLTLSTTNCEESFSDKANKTDHDTTFQHYENVVDPERLHDPPEKSNSTDKENFESAAKIQRLPSSRSQTKMLNQVSEALATKRLDTTSNHLQSSEKEISELAVKQKRPKSTITRAKMSGNETSTLGIKKNRVKSCSKRLKEIKAVVMKTQLKSSLNHPDINKLRNAPDNVSRDPGIENTNFGSSSRMLISMEDDEATRFSLFPSPEPKIVALNDIVRRVKNNETVPTDPLTNFEESPPTETEKSDHDIKIQPYEKFHIKDRPCGFSAKLNDADKENSELSASSQQFPSSRNRAEILKGNCKPGVKNHRLKLVPNCLESQEKNILETNAPEHGVKLTSNFLKQSEKEVSVLNHELQKSTSKCLKRSENEVLETMVAKKQIKLGNDNLDSPVKEIPKLVPTNQPPDDDSKGVKPPHLQHNAMPTENKKRFRQNRNSVDKPAVKHLQSVDETLNGKQTRPHEQLPIRNSRVSEEGRSAQKRPDRDKPVKPHNSFTDPEVNALPSSPTIDHKNLPTWADASWDTKLSQDALTKPLPDRPKGRRKGAHTCVVCDQSFVTRFRLSQHQKTEGHSSTRSFRRSLNSWLCNFCPLRFPVRDDLRAHVQTCHSSVSIPSDQPPKAEDLHEQYRVVCGFCEQTAADLRELRIHLQTSCTRSPYVNHDIHCRACGQRFQALYKLNLHARSSSCGPDAARLFSCPRCDQRYPRLDKLASHMQKECFRRYSCGGCSMELPNQKSLSAHRRQCLGRTCKTCGRLCKDYASLEIHVRQEHCGHDSVFHCVFGCDRLFDTLRDLLRHQRSKAGCTLSRHVCNRCSLGFASSETFKNHLLPCGQGRLVCPRCAFEFASMEHLQAHLQLCLRLCAGCGLELHDLLAPQKAEHVRECYGATQIDPNLSLLPPRPALVLPCPYCPMTRFVSKMAQERHISREHEAEGCARSRCYLPMPGRSFCQHCHLNLPNRTVLRSHVAEVHTHGSVLDNALPYNANKPKRSSPKSSSGRDCWSEEDVVCDYDITEGSSSVDTEDDVERSSEESEDHSMLV